jgi:hypothetical protein
MNYELKRRKMYRRNERSLIAAATGKKTITNGQYAVPHSYTQFSIATKRFPFYSKE